MDLSEMRKEYHRRTSVLDDNTNINPDPFEFFISWFDEATKCEPIIEPHGACLATSTKDGIPSARYMLIKSFNKDGFIFFTNYTSRKARELEENPKAALTFYWEYLSKSVRIEGNVEKICAHLSDKYFEQRPYISQLSTWISEQSKSIASRAELMQKETELKEKYKEGEVPRPETWGGFRLIPTSMEFWQGQTDRFHDRILFRKPRADEEPDNILTHPAENGWIYERLQP